MAHDSSQVRKEPKSLTTRNQRLHRVVLPIRTRLGDKYFNLGATSTRLPALRFHHYRSTTMLCHQRTVVCPGWIVRAPRVRLCIVTFGFPFTFSDVHVHIY